MPGRPYKNAAYSQLARVGKALSSPARLEILELLAQAPRRVDTLAREIHQSAANTSHHLQVLKRARLVRVRRDGLHRIYRVTSPEIAQLLAHLQQVATGQLAELDQLQREVFAELDGLEPLPRDALLDRLRAGAILLVDVRPRQEYEAGHAPGAISLPLAEREERIDELPPDRSIVAYCRGPFCTLSARAARRLRELGYEARRSDAPAHEIAAGLHGGAT